METIYDLLRKETNISNVFKHLAETQIKMQSTAEFLSYTEKKEETCERCNQISDKCECDEEFI
jgi:hypothetical protein